MISVQTLTRVVRFHQSIEAPVAAMNCDHLVQTGKSQMLRLGLFSVCLFFLSFGASKALSYGWFCDKTVIGNCNRGPGCGDTANCGALGGGNGCTPSSAAIGTCQFSSNPLSYCSTPPTCAGTCNALATKGCRCSNGPANGC